MRSIAKLFGRSPFVPMQNHMAKVADCVAKMAEIFPAARQGELEKVATIANEVSDLEHTADLVKQDIRNHLPRGLFLAIDRGRLLEILSIQDDIADSAENIAVLMTLRPLSPNDKVWSRVEAFLEKSIQCFHSAQRITEELDELIETGFGGVEAEQVKSWVDDVALQEHEADLIQRDLMKCLFDQEQEMTHGEFFLWMRINRQLAGISDLSENLANCIRMTLDLK